MMRKLFTTLLVCGAVVTTGVVTASAASYPKYKPREQSWSFAGPFGTYDKAQLQRGLKVYVENCASCHAMSRVPFRGLTEIGYSEEQAKSLAAQYEVEDGPNEDGDMFTRPATVADHFPPPFPNRKAAEASNNGAYPPDMSLLAKARAVERGFPTFVFDIFTQYQEGGPDYIYSLLTGYSDDVPEGTEVPEGTYYNPYFNAGVSLAMAPPLFEDGVEFDDGTPSTVSQQAKDVTAFLMWAAEPKLEQRKQLGFKVMVFLLVFAAFLYLSKKQVWSRVDH